MSLFNALETLPCVKRKADWAFKWMNRFESKYIVPEKCFQNVLLIFKFHIFVCSIFVTPITADFRSPFPHSQKRRGWEVRHLTELLLNHYVWYCLFTGTMPTLLSASSPLPAWRESSSVAALLLYSG